MGFFLEERYYIIYTWLNKGNTRRDHQLSTSRFNKNEFEHADIYRFSRNAIESFGAGRCSPLGASLLAWRARIWSAHVLRSVNGICHRFQNPQA